MLRLLVPEYELQDGIITPTDRPPKEVPVEGRLWPGPARSGTDRTWPLVLTDFMKADPTDDLSILEFTNRHGVLGCCVWDPFRGFPSLPDSPAGDEFRTQLGMLHEQRLRQLLRQPMLEPDAGDAEGWKCCLKEPRLFTLSLWTSESLQEWKRAWLEFQAVFHGARGVAGHLAQICSHKEVSRWASGLGREPLELVDMSIGALSKLLDGEGAQEGVLTKEPEVRFRTAFNIVEGAAASTFSAARPVLRPADDLVGFQWEMEPPCLLNRLYALMFTLLVAFPPRKCALPDCAAMIFDGDSYCSDEHGDRFRQHKSRAKKSLSLSTKEANEMARLAREQGLPFEAAGEVVVSRRHPDQPAEKGRRPTSTARKSPASSRVTKRPGRTT